jgi:hypothetical protein
MRRYEIESFYLQPVDEELIEFDNDGRKRFQIREHEWYIADEDTLKNRDTGPVEQSYHITDRNTLLKRQRFMQELLALAGIADDNGNLQSNTEIQASDLGEFVSYFKSHHLEIERWYNLDLRCDIDEKPVAQLSALLNHFAIPWCKTRTQKIDNRKIYFYHVPEELLQQLNAIVHRRQHDEISKQWRSQREDTQDNRLFNMDDEIADQIKEQIRQVNTSYK